MDIGTMRTLVARIPPYVLSPMPLACALCLVALARSRPVASGVFAACLLLTLAAMKVNRTEWTHRIQGGELGTVRYIDRPTPGFFVLEWVVPPVLGWLVGQSFDGWLGLTSLEWMLSVALLYLWIPFFRLYLPAEYTVTEQGTWIQHGIFRIYAPYDELREARHVPRYSLAQGGYGLQVLAQLPTSARPIGDRVLLFPAEHASFRGRVKTAVLITPSDHEEVLQYLPSHLLSGP